MIERVTDLTVPPEVGRKYLVPAIWDEKARRLAPVWGSPHTDVEFFFLDAKHYHPDRRFLTDRDRLFLSGVEVLITDEGGAPAYVEMTCQRRVESVPFPTPNVATEDMQHSLRGTQCRRHRTGWICPHKGFRLGSITPDDRGTINCPLHGLRVYAATGRVL